MKLLGSYEQTCILSDLVHVKAGLRKLWFANVLGGLFLNAVPQNKALLKRKQ